jgi:hypothetical protein
VLEGKYDSAFAKASAEEGANDHARRTSRGEPIYVPRQ